MLLAALAASAVVASTGNILTNPGFENDLAGWTILYPNAVSISTDVVHSGSKALLFTVGSGTQTNPLNGTVAMQSFSPPRSGPITALSFWCRVDPAPNANYTMDVSTLTGGGQGASATTGVLAAGQWTFFDLRQFFLAPTFNEFRFYFVSFNATPGTRVYIDDVTFVPGPGGAVVGVVGGAVLWGRRRRL